MEINLLIQEQVIKDYLKDFPSAEWETVLKKTLLYGIHSLKALETVGLASTKIEKVPALRLQIAEMKIAEVKKNIKEIQSSLKKNDKNRSSSNIGHKNLQEAHANRYKSQNRLTPRCKKKIKIPEGKYPTKLIGREIVTSRESRYIEDNKNKLRHDKAKTFRNSIKECHKDQNSSLSTFNPPDDMVKVFKNDFSRLQLQNSIPKILHPIEIKQPGHRGHNFSSISAQILCSSAEVSDSSK